MKKSGRYYLFSVIMIFSFCARARLIYTSVDSQNEKLSNVNAHAGSIIKNNNYFYWYGEYRDPSNNGSKGVSVYKSRDLIYWHYLGMAFNPDIRKNKSAAGIIERPKVIYFSKLNKFLCIFIMNLREKDTAQRY